MDFVVIDVETANPKLDSICQVGIAIFADGKFHESWSSLVDPEDYFDSYNVAIHGINERVVANAPTWAEVHDRLRDNYSNKILASHTPFDRTAVHRACQKAGATPFECRWLDTARVVRRTWPEFSRSGYGLANVASHLGISFKHHDAEEDARAAGEILLRAIQRSGSSAAEWCALSVQHSAPASVAREGRSEGVLYGSVLVFTGALSISRSDAADAAAAVGCTVASNVTKQTTILVVGDQDIRKLGGSEKSSKHRKAEELMAKGQIIRIIGETDFGEIITC